MYTSVRCWLGFFVCRLRVCPGTGELRFVRTLVCEYDRGATAAREVFRWEEEEEEEGGSA